MTQEDKQLLLKDLSARLRYGVICHSEKGNGHLCSINQTIFGTEYGLNINPLKRDYFSDSETEEQVIKPYLRPMSSITAEEWIKFYKCANCRIEKDFGEIGSKSRGFGEGYEYLGIDDMSDAMDWLIEHHFDMRGLIDKGLAIDCTDLNIY